MNDELSITISGGTPPTWHVRSTHDNYPSAFKALEAMRDSGRRAGKISVLTWLGKRYSESVTVDNFIDAFRALELQRDAVEARLGKPAHGFMVGDRVQPDTHFTDARGTVVSLVDKTHVSVEWDGGSTRTEYVKGLRGAIELDAVEQVVRGCTSGKFEAGDRVRYVRSSSGLPDLNLIGTVARVHDPVGRIAGYRYVIEWDKRGTSTEREDSLRLEQAVGDRARFKVGDRVRWHTDSTSIGTVVPNATTSPDHTRVKWDEESPNYGASDEHTRNLRLAAETIEPGDRVQSNTSSLYGSVLKPRSVTGYDEIAVRWDNSVQNLTVKRENVKKL